MNKQNAKQKKQKEKGSKQEGNKNTEQADNLNTEFYPPSTLTEQWSWQLLIDESGAAIWNTTSAPWNAANAKCKRVHE